MTLPITDINSSRAAAAAAAAAATATLPPTGNSITPSSSTDSLSTLPTSNHTLSSPSPSPFQSTAPFSTKPESPIIMCINKPTMITSHGLRMMITDAPNDNNLASYLTHMKKKNVVLVVRACEPTYSIEPLVEAGIRVEECAFPDGEVPSPGTIQKWLSLVDGIMSTRAATTVKSTNELLQNEETQTIAVHCVAGLGRAPLLVAIALVNRGMAAFDAVALIRKKRRGAINSKQLTFIEEYHAQQLKRVEACCIIA